MHLNITGHHIEVTEALKTFVEEKISKLAKHSDNISNVHVILTVEKGFQKAEATLHIDHHDLFAEDQQDDMYKAVDNLIAKLKRQILKHRQKMNSHR
ncbi:MAG: ribosome hibernation-promoting factor, HPF/YfiA family [Candidatus Eutrophobiaceae bacterium]